MSESAAGSQQGAGAKYPLAAWIELVSVVILSVAMLASAWSTYQSSLWEGEQTFALARSMVAGRESTRLSVEGNQRRTVDGQLFVAYLAALPRDANVAKFLFQQFRPELKEAATAWLAARPFDNPKAPSSPFVMPLYSVAEEQEEQRAAKQSADEFNMANRANGISDRYVLLTVLFSIAMFFAGIGPQFKRPRARAVLVGIGGLFLAVTLVVLAGYPVASL